MKWTVKSMSALLITALCGQAYAGGHEGGPGGPGGPGGGERRGPPPFVIPLSNMGEAGLLFPFFAGLQLGRTQNRMGYGRGAGANANNPMFPDGYEDEIYQAIPSIAGQTVLSQDNGVNYLRIVQRNRFTDGKDNLTHQDSRQNSLEVLFFRAPNKDFIWAAGFEYGVAEFELKHNGGDIDTTFYNIRGDILKRINDDWGVYGRAVYRRNENETFIPGNSFGFSGVDTDEYRDFLYLEGQAIGSFKDDELDWLPENWIFHPTFGLLLQRDFYETESVWGNDTEDYGKLFFDAAFDVDLEGYTPYLSVGVEHEFEAPYFDQYDEDTFVNFLVGTRVQVGQGNTFNVNYNQSTGVNGNRTLGTFVIGYSMSF
ncbi:MAG: hypothetical protein AAF965_02605 [Pseudomonadota bacterium]